MSEAAENLGKTLFNVNDDIIKKVTYPTAVQVIDFVLNEILEDRDESNLSVEFFWQLFDHGCKYGPDPEPKVRIEKDQYGNYRITPTGHFGPWTVSPECFKAIREWEGEA